MAKLKDFDTTPANNNDTPPFGWPEGMAPSAVNNTARQLYASLREWYEDAQWIELGHAVTSASGADIVFTGDVSSSYTVGQAVRSDGSYGWITAVVFSTNTTVTVSGFTFSGAPTLFEVAAVQADNALPYGGVVTTGDTSAQTIASDLNMQALGATTGTFSGAVSMTDLTATTGTFSGVVDFPDGSASAPSITNTGDTNTGVFFPAADTVGIATAGSERLRVDSSGSLGLGATPSAWASSRTAIQASNTAAVIANSAAIDFYMNGYFDGADKYIGTGQASRYRIKANGDYEWYTAPSGTAGNTITFTQAMALTNGGNLLVGTTTDIGSRAYIVDSGSVDLRIADGTRSVRVGTDGSVGQIGTVTNHNFALLTNDTERARITSGGYFKASNDGTYQNSTSAVHEFRTDADALILRLTNQSATTPFGIRMDFEGAAPDNNTQYFLQCTDTSTTRLQIWSDGDVVNHDGTYGTISDETLKSNIVDANSQWDDFKAFRFRNFQFNTDIEQYGQDAPTLLGVIAQELEQVSPGLVKENGEGIKQVKQSILYMKAMKVIQELQTRVEQLEAHH